MTISSSTRKLLTLLQYKGIAASRARRVAEEPDFMTASLQEIGRRFLAETEMEKWGVLLDPAATAAAEAEAENIIRTAEDNGIAISGIFDEDFPPGIRPVAGTLPVIYRMGAEIPMIRFVAMAGSVYCSRHSRVIAERLVEFLADKKCGICIPLHEGIPQTVVAKAIELGIPLIGFPECGLLAARPEIPNSLSNLLLETGNTLVGCLPFANETYRDGIFTAAELAGALSVGTIMVSGERERINQFRSARLLKSGRWLAVVHPTESDTTSSDPKVLLSHAANFMFIDTLAIAKRFETVDASLKNIFEVAGKDDYDKLAKRIRKSLTPWQMLAIQNGEDVFDDIPFDPVDYDAALPKTSIAKPRSKTVNSSSPVSIPNDGFVPFELPDDGDFAEFSGIGNRVTKVADDQDAALADIGDESDAGEIQTFGNYAMDGDGRITYLASPPPSAKVPAELPCDLLVFALDGGLILGDSLKEISSKYLFAECSPLAIDRCSSDLEIEGVTQLVASDDIAKIRNLVPGLRIAVASSETDTFTYAVLKKFYDDVHFDCVVCGTAQTTGFADGVLLQKCVEAFPEISGNRILVVGDRKSHLEAARTTGTLLAINLSTARKGLQLRQTRAERLAAAELAPDLPFCLISEVAGFVSTAASRDPMVWACTVPRFARFESKAAVSGNLHKLQTRIGDSKPFRAAAVIAENLSEELVAVTAEKLIEVSGTAPDVIYRIEINDGNTWYAPEDLKALSLVLDKVLENSPHPEVAVLTLDAAQCAKLRLEDAEELGLPDGFAGKNVTFVFPATPDAERFGFVARAAALMQVANATLVSL